jgi:mannosyltransferase
VTDLRADAVPWARSEEDSTVGTPWILLAALTVLAALLRAIGLDGGLWWDEIRTLLDSVRPPLGQILSVFPGNNQHTLYSVLAHASIEIFGEAPWSLRLPAFVFGVATIPALYFFAREFVGRTEALLASLLLAVSYHHVWFSQNARGYTLLAFLAVVSSALLLRGLRRNKLSDYIGYAITAALGAYTHLTMVFMVVAHAVACALLLGVPRADRDSLRRWRQPATGFALAACFTLLLYAPLLLDVRQFFLKQPGAAAQVATPKWAALEMLRGLRVGAGTAFGALAGALMLVCGSWSYFRQSRFLLALFLLPGVLTVAGAIVLGRPIFPRFLFFLAGFGILIIVRGAIEIGAWLTRLWNPGVARDSVTALGVGLVALMGGLSVASLPDNYRYPKQDFAGAMQFVRAHRAEDQAVVTAGAAAYPYREYYHQPWEAVTSPDQLKAVRDRGSPVWVVYTLADYLEAGAPELMAMLRSECRVEAVFRGTVASGDVTVCVMPATKNNTKRPAERQPRE